MKVIRGILAAIAGLVVAWLTVFAVEAISHKFYPPPPGADMHDMETITKFVSTLPAPAFALVLGGYLVGTLLGTFVATRIGRSRVPAYVVAVILLAGGIVNAKMIPQPTWFTAACIAVFVIVPFAGVALAGKRPESAPA